MTNIWEKAISIFAGNLNLDVSYLITTVSVKHYIFLMAFHNFTLVLDLSLYVSKQVKTYSKRNVHFLFEFFQW